MNKPDVNAAIKVSARYKLQRVKESGEIVEESGWSDNILTIGYFNKYFGTALFAYSCVVGSGNATPLESNTTLQSFIAATKTLQTAAVWNNNWTVSPRYSKVSQKWRFGLGVAAGNISEVGVSDVSTATAASAIMSRALVVDGVGAPTTITVLSDEYLDVVWECTWFQPEDVAGTFNMTLDGVVTSIAYVLRPSGMKNTGNWAPGGGSYAEIGHRGLWAIPPGNSAASVSHVSGTQTLAGYDQQQAGYSSGYNADSFAWDSYVANSKQRSGTLSWGLNSGNFSGGVGYFLLGGQYGPGDYQMTVTPKINKTNVKVMTLTVNMSIANA